MARAPLADAEAKSATRRAHAGDVNRYILPPFGERRVDAIGTKDVRNWFDDPTVTRAGTSNRVLAIWRFWVKTRDMAVIVANARVHDLRHSHASHAVMKGESLYVAGRLLGHRWVIATNRYLITHEAHVDPKSPESTASWERGLPARARRRMPSKVHAGKMPALPGSSRNQHELDT